MDWITVVLIKVTENMLCVDVLPETVIDRWIGDGLEVEATETMRGKRRGSYPLVKIVMWVSASTNLRIITPNSTLRYCKQCTFLQICFRAI